MGLQAAVHLGHMPWALTKEQKKVKERVDLYHYCPSVPSWQVIE
jgi:hypothetical protein